MTRRIFSRSLCVMSSLSMDLSASARRIRQATITQPSRKGAATRNTVLLLIGAG
jgi:hypothetical protein